MQMAIKSNKLQHAEKITRLAPNFQVSKALLSHTSVNSLNTNLVKSLTHNCPKTCYKAVADQDSQYDNLILSCGAIMTW